MGRKGSRKPTETAVGTVERLNAPRFLPIATFLSITVGNVSPFSLFSYRGLDSL